MIPSIKVAHIAPIYYPIPTPGYGGVERVIDELLEAQHRIGLDRTRLYATSDSSVDVETRSAISSCHSLKRHVLLEEIADMEHCHYSFALTNSEDCDIIHAHGTWVLPYARLTRRPIVLSVYTDTADPSVRAELQDIPAHVALVANSRRTREKFPEAPWQDVVLEGVIPERYPYQSQKGDFLLFVGAMIPRKGPHLAIQTAKTLGLPLVLIGPQKPMHEPKEVILAQEIYWQTEIAPYLQGDRIKFLGEMGEERLDYIREAKAVLCPIQWEEPFGRIFAESMACGTPVVAFRCGAVEEVIQDRMTGFVVDTLDEMIHAVQHIGEIDPASCREHVRQHLHMERVARDYLSIYARLIE
jgi:glycosyltransferase involved in cell wall biosynthesis